VSIRHSKKIFIVMKQNTHISHQPTVSSVRIFRRFHGKRGGFTVVELIGVLVLMGIIAGGAIFAIRGATRTANLKALHANVLTINASLMSFADSGGQFGSSAQGSPGTGGADSVDGAINSASAATIIADLSTGVYASGVLFQVRGTFTPASYTKGGDVTLTTAGGSITVPQLAIADEAKDGSKRP
jgi:type II secretory pathway pseudopilin PulG